MKRTHQGGVIAIYVTLGCLQVIHAINIMLLNSVDSLYHACKFIALNKHEKSCGDALLLTSC